MVEAAHSMIDARQIERVFSFSAGGGLAVEEMQTSSSTMQGRWTATVAGGELQVFGAFERFTHTHHSFRYGYNVSNAEVQHHATRGRHEFIVGGGYRFTDDYVEASERLALTPTDVAEGMFSVFAQDELRWAGDRGRLTLGSRVGKTEFTGWGWQPTARILWQLTPTQNVWAATSRALRTPSRGDRGFRLNVARLPGPGTPRVVSTLGQSEFRDEELRGFETGYRAAPRPGLTIDVVTFLNHYTHLLSIEPGASFAASSPIPHLVLPRYRSNLLAARTAGVEVSTVWSPIASWRLESTYARFHIDPTPAAGSLDPNGPEYDGSTPRHQGSVRSRLSLRPAIDFDVNLFAVGRLRQLDIPSFTRLDTRLAWRARSGLELAITGQDLLRRRHFEFGGIDTESSATEVPRSVAIEATWQFQR
jgi:iron complex outermembrane receptor protein